MPKKTEIDHYSDKEALDFHIKGKSGKIEIGSSKPLTTKRDLSLAYSPGVAAPVKKISLLSSTAVSILHKSFSYVVQVFRMLHHIIQIHSLCRTVHDSLDSN